MSATFVAQFFSLLNTPQNLSAFQSLLAADVTLLNGPRAPVTGAAAVAAALAAPPDTQSLTLNVTDVTFQQIGASRIATAAIEVTMIVGGITFVNPSLVALTFDPLCRILAIQAFGRTVYGESPAS